MFPVMLDISSLPILLIGSGKAAQRRWKLLKEAGAEHITVYAPHPESEMETLAGTVIARLPDEEEIKAARLLLVADMEENVSEALAALARKHGCLVNVEDRRPWCDFYYTSTVRRGGLVLSVSTSGKSPALSVRLRKWLEQAFPEQWKARLEQLEEKRRTWKQEGLSAEEIITRSNAVIDENAWLQKLDD